MVATIDEMKTLLLVALIISLPAFADCSTCGLNDIACIQSECDAAKGVNLQQDTGSGTVSDVANAGAESVKNQRELSTYEQWQALRYSNGVPTGNGNSIVYSPYEQYGEVNDKYRGAFDGQ